MTDFSLVEQYRQAMKVVADADADIAQTERLLAHREAEIRLCVEGKNETERKAAAEVAVADDPECTRLAFTLDGFKRTRAYALADAEASKYAIRLTVATLTADREQVA